MAFTDIFVRRPVLAIVVNLVILVAGLQAVRSLTVRQYPESENASITISTVYVGADAELVRGFVTVPLERAIAAADGIEYLQSTSARGLSTITARLALDHDGNEALAEISSKVDQVRADLPPEAEVPTINLVTADTEFAAAYLSFDSLGMEQNEITDYLLRVVQPRLAAVPGVQRAEILGARNFAMRVWLDAERLAAYGISASEIRDAIGAGNFLAAVGQTKGALIQVNLAAETDLRTVEEFRQLVVRERDGALVRLGDVADVVMGADNYDSNVRASGRTATFMGVWVLPSANAIEVLDRVNDEMERLQSDLPAGLAAGIAYDSTEYIEDALAEVVTTLLETLLIVVIVIFLFLGSLRTVLVPIVAIPVSLIGAIFLIQLFGFTINLLTLLAIVLSVGLVVDDAIVMVENVERNLRRGLSRIDAALVGARELVGPIISMTIALAAVYAPIGLQGGLTGSLFREFALTLAGAVLISGVVALTLSPVMSAYLLPEGGMQRGLPRLLDLGFDKLRRGYGRLLDASLRARPAVYVVWIGLSLVVVAQYRMSPTELAPTEDQGVVFGILDTPAHSSLEYTSAAAEAADDIFLSLPEAEYSFQIISPAGGFAGVVLKPWGERERTTFEIQPEITAQMGRLPSIELLPILPPALPGGGQFPVEFILGSTAEHEQVLEIATELQQRATMSGIFAFPPILDTRIDQPLTRIELDRDKIAALGLDMREVGADLAAAIGGNFVNRFDIDGLSYKVIPQVRRADRLNPGQLAEIHIGATDGSLIPLDAIATLVDEVQPRALPRFQQLNSVALVGVPIRPLDEALTFLEDEAAKLMPQGYVIDYTGESRQLRNEGNAFLFTLLLSLVLIYLVLAAQFDSFRDPFVILAGSVPLAMFGALIFTFLKMPNDQTPFWTAGWTTTLNIYSQVGLVTLVGLVSKNGILIVEFANVLQREGKSKLDAVSEAARVRLRPVLMTSFATVLGHLPLTLVSGAGAEARNSIGLVLVTGMAIGTAFTLFIVPSIYMLFAATHRPD